VVVPMDASPAGAGKLGFTLRIPIGVVAAISPFNLPLNLVAHKVAPVLAAGCPVVLKPASATPLSPLLLEELEQEAGLPEGWFEVVTGRAGEIGDVFVRDERVKLIPLTGSASSHRSKTWEAFATSGNVPWTGQLPDKATQPRLRRACCSSATLFPLFPEASPVR
jgi:acyl-CoA reductase-like NAD-dependent aldehyde dehydrogenase